MMALWHEFDEGASAESMLAQALDRVQPALLHEATEGVIWEKYGTTHDQIQAKMVVVERAAPVLWTRIQDIISKARAAGKLR